MKLLGVDGGGSKTAALLVDERGQVVGAGSSSGSNYHRLGLVKAVANVTRAVDAALRGQSPDAICYCLAAADTTHDLDMLRVGLSNLELSAPAEIRNDLMGVFRAGSRFPYGVGVVCGTGFNAGGVDKAGQEFRLPALGVVTGDRAGSGHLGPQALGEAFRAWDGRGEPTALAQTFLEALAAPDFETLAERFVQGTLTEEQIKALAPLVFEASEAGDSVAQRLIHEHGVELGVAANAILRRLELADDDCDVVLGGGIFYGKGNLLLNTINEVVHAFAPKAVVKRLDVPPVVGAVLLAADSAGVQVDEGFAAALRATLPGEMRVSFAA